MKRRGNRLDAGEREKKRERERERVRGIEWLKIELVSVVKWPLESD